MLEAQPLTSIMEKRYSLFELAYSYVNTIHFFVNTQHPDLDIRHFFLILKVSAAIDNECILLLYINLFGCPRLDEFDFDSIQKTGNSIRCESGPEAKLEVLNLGIFSQ